MEIIFGILLIHIITAIVLGIMDYKTRYVNVIGTYLLFFTLPLFFVLFSNDGYPLLYYYSIGFIFFITLFGLVVENPLLRKKIGITDDFVIFKGGVMDLPIYGLMLNIIIYNFYIMGIKDLLVVNLISVIILTIYLFTQIIKGEKTIPLFTIYTIYLLINIGFNIYLII